MKKSKKGFTLVELLAVIVILAIILIIAVPIVLKQIRQSKQNSHVLSANELAKSAKTKALEDDLDSWDLSDDSICEDLVDEACSDIIGGELFYDEESDSISGYIDFDDEYDVTIYQDVAEAFSEEEQENFAKNSSDYYDDKDFVYEAMLTSGKSYDNNYSLDEDFLNKTLTDYASSGNDLDTSVVLKCYDLDGNNVIEISDFTTHVAIYNTLKTANIKTCNDFVNKDSYLECSKLDYNNDGKLSEEDTKLLENKISNSDNTSPSHLKINTDLLGSATKEYDLDGDGYTSMGDISILQLGKIYGIECKKQKTKDAYIACTKMDYDNSGTISASDISFILVDKYYDKQTAKYTLNLSLFD